MAESTLSTNWGKLRRAMAHYLGWGMDPAKWGIENRSEILQDLLDAGVSQVYFAPVIPGEDLAHRFSWMNPTKSITVRAELAGTLFAIPTRDGSQFLMRAKTALFTSALEGEVLTFTATDTKYTITEYISTDTVRVIGDGESDFGFARTGTLTSEPSGAVTRTTITATTAKFTPDMPGYTLEFGDSGNRYHILEWVDESSVKVQGNASAETGAMTVKKTATIDFTVFNQIVTNEPVFRQDMADESDTITGGTNTLTITDYISPTRVAVSGAIAGLSAGTAITINRALTLSTATALIANWIFHDSNAVFVDADKGKYIVFEPPGLAARAYLIVLNLTPTSLEVVGDASLEQIGDAYSIVLLAAVASAKAVYVSPTSTLTITTSSFTESHVGKTVKFRTSGNKYTIVSRTSATEVVLAGNAGGEEKDDDVYIVGPSDLAASDAFTVSGGGGDYDLPDDYGSLLSRFSFDPDQATADIAVVGEDRIRSLRQTSGITGRPTLAAVHPKRTDGTEGQRFTLMLYPEPGAEYVLTFRYVANPQALTEAAPYPLGGAPHADLFMASCLAVAERRMNDERGIKWEEFMVKLQSAVMADRVGAAPRYLGYNADRSHLLSEPMTRAALHDSENVRASYLGVFY